MRGVSLDEIVATTKISRRLLQALEDEQFDLLPGGIFNKSYVKAYAKCVGIDEDEAVSEYLQASQEAPPDTRLIAQQHASIHSDRRPGRSGFPLVPVLVLMVVAAGGVGGWKMYQDHLRERELAAPHASTTESSTAPQAAPVSNAIPAENNSTTTSASQSQAQAPPPDAVAGPAASTPRESTSPTPASAEKSQTAAQPPAADSPFEITVRPKDRAWVSIKADGNYVVRGIIQPPVVKTIHATSQVVFYIGNVGAVDVAFDGKDIPLTGGANDTETLVFDSHGLRPKAPAQ